MLQNIPVWTKNHLLTCVENKLLTDKDILEVGGKNSYTVTKSLGAKSWTSVDPSVESDLNNPYNQHYKEFIENFKSKKKFDTIIATNSFEHIQNLEPALDKMYKLLKPGGYLSALMGPIWSCHKGHHVLINNEIDFNNIILPPWAHLLYEPNDLEKILQKNYSPQIVKKAISQLINWDFLNHLFYDDYLEIIKRSKFNIIEFRDWHTSKFPDTDTQKLLEQKFKKHNFSTVSIKILLQK